MKIRVTLREGCAQLRSEADLKRATEEMTRVLGFRGNVLSGELTKSGYNECIVHIETNPSWGLPQEEQWPYLESWITAKLKVSFVVDKFEREAK